ncbi:hypothetical protein [Streptomyces sp. NPDC048551]|uniref:hypothetical protein n=1 Tax=Streptomyces sp. NPDC048551 TaxID=3155758 RepID=UPI00341C20C7
MSKVYKRTENGTATIADRRTGLDEINAAMIGEAKKTVRTMSSISRTDYAIDYRDGRTVRLILVDAPAEERTAEIRPGRTGQVVTANGKDYVVGKVIPADRPTHVGAPKGWEPTAYVDYWSVRNGKAFDPVRTTNAEAKSGTVGALIWAQLSADADQ